MRLATPSALIDINRVPGLDHIRLAPEGLVIGALARHQAVERSPLVATHAPLVAAAMPHVGHEAIRTRGTLGGSLALADPAAELPACMVALDASIRTARRGGGRTIRAPDFFRGIYTTALEPGELIAEIVIPPPGPGWRSAFMELARRQGDYALVGLAAHARVGDGLPSEVRLVFFGVGPTPVRAHAVEAVIVADRDVDTALDGALDPPGDVHASPALRRHLARVLLRRAWAQIREGRPS
jgi:carbon-monoxide dehydrogenase medium subunit